MIAAKCPPRFDTSSEFQLAVGVIRELGSDEYITSDTTEILFFAPKNKLLLGIIRTVPISQTKSTLSNSTLELTISRYSPCKPIVLCRALYGMESICDIENKPVDLALPEPIICNVNSGYAIELAFLSCKEKTFYRTQNVTELNGSSFYTLPGSKSTIISELTLNDSFVVDLKQKTT